MKYHYEAVPVLFNILLFFLMLYPFPNVYRYGCEFRKRYTDILDYAVYGVLLILFCTFGYADNDFYHYEGLFKRICSVPSQIRAKIHLKSTSSMGFLPASSDFRTVSAASAQTY